jgi:hypothetical protein
MSEYAYSILFGAMVGAEIRAEAERLVPSEADKAAAETRRDRALTVPCPECARSSPYRHISCKKCAGSRETAG